MQSLRLTLRVLQAHRRAGLALATHRGTPSKLSRWGKLQRAPCYAGSPCAAFFRTFFFMVPLCLRRTAFMMKWRTSGWRRRQNGRRRRSWSGKRSCYSKVSTETSVFLMARAPEKPAVKFGLNLRKAALDSLRGTATWLVSWIKGAWSFQESDNKMQSL